MINDDKEDSKEQQLGCITMGLKQMENARYFDFAKNLSHRLFLYREIIENCKKM